MQSRRGPIFREVSALVGDAWRVTRGGPQLIEARQQARLRSLVTFARSRSRFYGDLYREVPRNICDIRALPVVTKAALMARFDDWVTDPEITKAKVEAFVSDPSRAGGEFLDRYVVWTTSGATGTPAILVQDQRSLAVMMALGIVRALPAWIGQREMQGFLTRGIRGALLFATGGHFMALTTAERARRRSALVRRLGEVISVLTPVPQMVSRLNELDPTVIASYASALVLLAEEQAAGRLHINPVLMLSTGESLSTTARERVEEVFQQKVRETYGASEIQIAAFECRSGRLHVNADWVILEPVDDEFRPVAPGEASRTVLATSLSNRVQPIIRYDLGDRITVYADPCPCGSPLPSIRVEGRTDEVLTFNSPTLKEVHLLPTALTTSIAEIPGLYRFQLIRKGPGRLVVRIEVEPDRSADEVWSTVYRVLRQVLDSNGLTNVAIEHSPEAPSPLTRAGKIRQVWSEPA